MRKRSPRVVWLPSTNANSLGQARTSNAQLFVLGVSGAPGDFAVGEIPLVIDGQNDPLAATNTLSDIENSGYRLRRIVGKVWIKVQQVLEATPPEAVYTAGLIVRRADDITGASYAQLTTDGELVSPGQIRNIADPWIWRRSWLLGNNSSPLSLPLEVRPETNEFFSAVDGPHVDQKTARIVGPEERLFLSVSATILTGTPSLLDLNAVVVCDLRVLGSMRTTSGNRRNASR